MCNIGASIYNAFIPRLFLEKLPKEYPDYNKPEYKVDRNKIKKLVKEAFPRAEELKKKLLIHYEAEKAALEAKLAEEVVCYFSHPCLSLPPSLPRLSLPYSFPLFTGSHCFCDSPLHRLKLDKRKTTMKGEQLSRNRQKRLRDKCVKRLSREPKKKLNE